MPIASSASPPRSPKAPCRMACLLGVQRSFQKAEVALLEVAGWDLDDNTIRQLCHATASRARSTRECRDTAEAFARAEGDLELHIGAGKVNTLRRWARREGRRPGPPHARPADHPPQSGTSGTCPAPAVRSVVAAVEEAATFGVASWGDAAGTDRSEGDPRAGRWGRMDLEPGGATIPRGLAMPGLLARRRPPRRRGQGRARRSKAMRPRPRGIAPRRIGWRTVPAGWWSGPESWA